MTLALPPLLCGCGAIEIPRIGPGAGQHVARLECAACGRFLKWAPRALVQPSQQVKETSVIVCVNRCVLLGTIGKFGMEMRSSTTGTACASFMLVVTERGVEGKDHASLIPCECWGKGAPAAGELKAGQLVLFEGRLRRRQKGEQWETIVSGFEVCPIRAEDPA